MGTGSLSRSWTLPKIQAVGYGSCHVDNGAASHSDVSTLKWKAPQARSHSSRDSCCLSNPHEWPGLAAWRARGHDLRLRWGPPPDAGGPLELSPEEAPSLESALALAAASAASVAAALGCQQALSPHLPSSAPALPGLELCQLPRSLVEAVRPKEIPGHESSPLGLNGYMLHNLAHIELNAIDLAWDTVARFSPLGLPDQFYEDFARVADDESRHLGWCLQRLGELGHRYGDMDAHDLLWQGCRASAVDVGARLAVVPMSQEARGLDAGSRLVSRLVGFGDPRSAAVVSLIAEEERAHVAVGVTWFTRLCSALEIGPCSLYRQWLLHLNPDLLKGPFNHSERSRVGLPRECPAGAECWPYFPVLDDLSYRCFSGGALTPQQGFSLRPRKYKRSPRGPYITPALLAPPTAGSAN
ncbi:hypothetical protein VOLCADRAFT_104455 [Volvox carteri f. nagariensis]|uniref:Uncharacterized protein n=1 Tax=Volvox carteri f. nagariensis TaxID=3068 RepID=D8TTQ5_VOLCA|nr:uncharacterized protein VOLCADRAFT_104455 [Volvox carteri f. nagariensis]EFJ49236.1 hypothetical protein VOLCADRAFT_104455 [Volvox carteri f. nagariensis]|eukprot:XP_002949684.1 hypothetical protein VOLCADRAFT_104455 [Volvox carteri f. nagariensis]